MPGRTGLRTLAFAEPTSLRKRITARSVTGGRAIHQMKDAARAGREQVAQFRAGRLIGSGHGVGQFGHCSITFGLKFPVFHQDRRETPFATPL